MQVGARDMVRAVVWSNGDWLQLAMGGRLQEACHLIGEGLSCCSWWL